MCIRVHSWLQSSPPRPAEAWVIASLALKTELMLTNQECGKDLEYRVIPVNNTGQGEPSATIAVVL